MTVTPIKTPPPTKGDIIAAYRDSEKKSEQARVRAEVFSIREKRAERKSDTRRKIIIGGYVLALIAEGKPLGAEIVKSLNENMVSVRDRALVGQLINIEAVMPAK